MAMDWQSFAAAGVGRAGLRPFRQLSFWLLAVVVVVVYAPGWRVPPYADDYLVMIAAEVGITGGASAGQIMFRPVELLLLKLSFALSGGPELVKLANLVGLLLTTAMLFWLAGRLAPDSRALPIVVATLFACHPGNVVAVSEIDTVSQQYATVTVTAAFAWYGFGRRHRPSIYHLAGAGLAFLALLSKEAAVGAVFALPVAVVLIDAWGRAEPLRPVLRRATLILACLTVVFAVYMGLRAWAGATLDAGEELPRYGLGLLNLIRNVTLLLGSVAYLGSTLEVFLLEDPIRMTISGLLTLAVLALAALGAIGLLRSRRDTAGRRLPLAVTGAATLMVIASLFPVVLIGWPSELHGYLPRPFYTLVVGFLAVGGAALLADRLRLPSQAGGVLGGAGLILLAGWMLYGVSDKLAHAAVPAARSQAFLAQMTEWYRGEGAGSGLVTTCIIEDKADKTPVYSVYAPDSYSLVQPISDWLNHRFRPWLDLPPNPAPMESCRLIIEIRGDQLEVRKADR